MKIQQHDPEFRPVVITLESQDEVDRLWRITNQYHLQHGKGMTGEFCQVLNNQLGQYVKVTR